MYNLMNTKQANIHFFCQTFLTKFDKSYNKHLILVNYVEHWRENYTS